MEQHEDNIIESVKEEFIKTATEPKEEAKKKKATKKAKPKADKRKKENRKYIGEEPIKKKGRFSIIEKLKLSGAVSEDQIETVEDIQGEAEEYEREAEEEITTKGKKKQEKRCDIYICPMCNTEDLNIQGTDDPQIEGIIAFKESDDAAKHMKESHGLVVIPEDIEENCILNLPKAVGEKIIKGMVKINEDIAEQESLQELRFKAAMETPKDLEPENIVSEMRAKNPEQVYQEAIKRIIAPPGTNDEENIYTESISGGMIQVTLIKTLPLVPEVISALAALKKYM